MKSTVRTKTYLTLLLVAALLLVCLVFSSVFGGAVKAGDEASAHTKEAMKKVYEIYPTPHSVVYGDGEVNVTDDVKVEFGDGIDQVTKNHLYDALSLIDVLSGGSAEGDTKVLVGVYGSGDSADEFVGGAVDFEPSLFGKIDAYILYIGGNTIAVLGKDTDAAFYGITTLDMILGQSGATVRELTVLDYSDSEYRGFIEGYYGTPWTTDERIELMKFGSKFKTNIYIYAPKDDPYHSRNWRGLYTGADFAALKEQIAAGNATKTRFTWSIHPLMENSDPFTRKNYDRDIQVLLAKLQQIYDAGCRSFMVSADDINGNKVDGACQRDMLNDVQEWLVEKGDCSDLIFVSSSYCGASESSLGVNQTSYYAELMDGLDARINVMWTGQNVCSRLSDGAYARFDELTGGRRPFVWMNWPVTDYNPTYLLLGAGEVLDIKTASGKAPFSGVVVNPMQYAEMSKLSIFAAGDYCWNIDGFDVRKSYKASFKYVDDGAPLALENISDNLSNTSGKIGDGYFAESVSIKPYIDGFLNAYNSGDFIEQAVNLSNQFDIIIASCDLYERDASNAKLLVTIKPWLSALKRLALSAQQYLDLLVKAQDDLSDDLKDLYYSAAAVYDSMEECVCPVLKQWSGTPLYEPVHVAPTVLTPFVEQLRTIATEDVAVLLGVPTGITAVNMGNVYGTNGPIENITDGDPSTFVWFDRAPDDGAFIRIDLGEVKDVNKLRVLNGRPAGANVVDMIRGYIDYSIDGKTYTKLADLAGADTVVSLPDANKIRARFIRIVSSGTSNWAALREVYVNDLGGLTGPVVYAEKFGTASVAGGYPGSDNLYNIIDGDINTCTSFNKDGREVGGSVTIDLMENIELEILRVAVGKPDGGDSFKGHVEYSVDGVNYVEIGDLAGADSVITLDSKTAARYIRIVVNELPAGWMAIREVFINELGGLSAVIKTSGFGNLYKGSVYNMIDGDDSTYCWFDRTEVVNGGYAQIDYMEVKSFSKVTVLTGTGMEEGMNDTINGHVEYSADGVEFVRLGDLTGTETVINLPSAVSARYIRIVNDGTAHYTAIREVKIL